MKADEMKELALLVQKVPGLKGIDFKDVKRLAERAPARRRPLGTTPR
jgi:hypothetical protein